MTETNIQNPTHEELDQNQQSDPNFVVSALVKFRESRLQSKRDELEYKLGRLASGPDLQLLYYPADDHRMGMSPGTERLPEGKREARDPRTGKWTFIGENSPIPSGSTYRREYRSASKTRAPVTAGEALDDRLSAHRQSKSQTIRANTQYRLKEIYGSDIGTDEFVNRVKSERWPASMRRRALRAHKTFIKSESKAAKLDHKVIRKTVKDEDSYGSKVEKKSAKIERKIEKTTEKIDQIHNKYNGVFPESETNNQNTAGNDIRDSGKKKVDATIKSEAKHTLKGAKLVAGDAKALSKLALRTGGNLLENANNNVVRPVKKHTKAFYHRKKTEATDNYQAGLTGTPNEGMVFPVLDEKVVKPLARKAGEALARRRSNS